MSAMTYIFINTIDVNNMSIGRDILKLYLILNVIVRTKRKQNVELKW